MIDSIREIFDWATSELMGVQFCDNWADDAVRERLATEEIMHTMCLRFQELLIEDAKCRKSE